MGIVRTLQLAIRAELESPHVFKRFGTGWISGVLSLVLALASLFLVIALRHPTVLTIPEARPFYFGPWFRLGLHLLLICSFLFAILNMLLRQNKILGSIGMTITLLATILGGSRVQGSGELTGGFFLGLDWFVLNVLFTGFLFIPFERLFSRIPEQRLFRVEWREDLFYFVVSSLFVQVLSFLSLGPAQLVLAHTAWDSFRAWIGGQPIVVQLLEIMLLTDLVQYWVHRAFHRVPFLWKFHAVHHSAQSMDWMAGARMHVLEIIVLRALTVLPMMVLGYSEMAVHIYILAVYIHSTFLHANIGWNADSVGALFATPRFHHWHHGIEREAIDVNFAIHFPWLDRLFGTYYFPRGKWPASYGIGGHPVPLGYVKQFLYPFIREGRKGERSEHSG